MGVYVGGQLLFYLVNCFFCESGAKILLLYMSWGGNILYFFKNTSLKQPGLYQIIRKQVLLGFLTGVPSAL